MQVDISKCTTRGSEDGVKSSQREKAKAANILRLYAKGYSIDQVCEMTFSGDTDYADLGPDVELPSIDGAPSIAERQRKNLAAWRTQVERILEENGAVLGRAAAINTICECTVRLKELGLNEDGALRDCEASELNVAVTTLTTLLTTIFDYEEKAGNVMAELEAVLRECV